MQASFASLSLILAFIELPLAAAFLPPPEYDEPIDCRGTAFNATLTRFYVCGDARLGPKLLGSKATEDKSLPVTKILDCILQGYDRLGGEKTAAGFLSRYTNKDGWDYPNPKWHGYNTTAPHTFPEGTTMNEGDYVDRFGHDGGQFLAPLGTLYSKRSIPPSNLNPDPFWPVPKNIYNNYHVYRVIKPFKVYNGSIAAGFGQPGQGRQYYTKKVPIHTLLKGGDLEEVDPADVVDEVLKRGCK